MLIRSFAGVVPSMLIAAALFAGERFHERTWAELKTELPGKKVHLVLTSGEIIDGRCETVSESNLTVKSSSRDSRQISRSSVQSIRVVVRKGAVRALLAAGLGVGAAVVVAAAVLTPVPEGPVGGRMAAICSGAAGGAVAGYFIGRRLDDRSYWISIAKASGK